MESELPEIHVVTCFVRSEGEVLLLKRSDAVGSYAGAWGAVAGHVEGDPDESARREIGEETGFADVEMVRRGAPFPVTDRALGRRWIVHPYLFEAPREDPQLNYESTAAEWVSPAEILRRDVVPQLWDSYRAVAPTAEDVRRNREHGSTVLSLRALEVLRDAAAEGAPEEALRETAADLVDAQRSMAAVRNRLNRAMHGTSGLNGLARADAIHDQIRRAAAADRAAAAEAARLLAGVTVLTLSRSGTVMAALRIARPRVIVAISHPGGEGAGVAARLAREGLDVTLVPDAALASAPPFDLVLLGGDTLLPDGTVVNKVGSHLAALVARERGVPVYVATSVDKLLPDGEPELKQVAPDDVADVPSSVRVVTDLFERVAPEFIEAYATEDGLLRHDDLLERAADFRRYESW